MFVIKNFCSKTGKAMYLLALPAYKYGKHTPGMTQHKSIALEMENEQVANVMCSLLNKNNSLAERASVKSNQFIVVDCDISKPHSKVSDIIEQYDKPIKTKVYEDDGTIKMSAHFKIN